MATQDDDLEEALNEKLLSSTDEDIILPKMDEPIKVDSNESSDGYKDVLFSFAFVAHLLLVLAIAISYGSVALANDTASFWIISSSGEETYDPTYENMPEKFVFGLFLSVALATALSMGWVYFIARTATFVVYTLILSIVIFSMVSGLSLMSRGYTYFSMPLILTALMALVVALLYQDRITFASVNLQTACVALLHSPHSIFLSLVVLCAQVIYTIIWVVAVVGFSTNAYDVTYVYDHIYYHMDQCDSYTYYSTLSLDSLTLTCDKSVCYACVCDDHMVSSSKCMRPRYFLFAYIFFLFSLFWTHSVLGNIIHVTTSGVVWDWWRGVDSSDQAFMHLTRACSTSLGSICLGSMMSSIVHTLRSVVQTVVYYLDQRQAHHGRFQEARLSYAYQCQLYSFRVLNEVMVYLDKAVVYFNRYALCMIAMDGKSYVQSAHQALLLFSSKGLDALLNNDILDHVISIYIYSIAFACMSAAYIYGRYVHLTRIYVYMLVISAGGASYVVCATVLAPVLAAIVAVYVCFARDPQSFEKTHPELYAPLANAWCKLHPSCLHLARNHTPQVVSQQPTQTVTSADAPTPRIIRGSFAVPSVQQVQDGPRQMTASPSPMMPGPMTRVDIRTAASGGQSAGWGTLAWGRPAPGVREDPREAHALL